MANAKTSVEYNPEKLARVKEVLGTTTFKDSIDEAWDAVLSMRSQQQFIQALIDDPVDEDRVDGPGIQLTERSG